MVMVPNIVLLISKFFNGSVWKVIDMGSIPITTINYFDVVLLW